MHMEKHTILVIEDDVDINELLSTFLQEDGFTVIQAHSGLEALPHITDNLSLVLLDLMLPRLSGEDTLFEI